MFFSSAARSSASTPATPTANIRDSDIRTYVDRELERGKLWPEALIQLSPAYAQTAAELVANQVLHPTCAQIFQAGGQPVRLYHHQRRAIDLAARVANQCITSFSIGRGGPPWPPASRIIVSLIAM